MLFGRDSALSEGFLFAHPTHPGRNGRGDEDEDIPWVSGWIVRPQCHWPNPGIIHFQFMHPLSAQSFSEPMTLDWGYWSLEPATGSYRELISTRFWCQILNWKWCRCKKIDKYEVRIWICICIWFCILLSFMRKSYMRKEWLKDIKYPKGPILISVIEGKYGRSRRQCIFPNRPDESLAFCKICNLVYFLYIIQM